ncbi:MAG: NUDIX domain-containing protein, partial [Saprospiraceae bacterium]|nr:NUDIX domain-containing protein [Saprospiraceae bacterium]
LQQTQVAQGTPYYLKFIEHYPTVHDLARAPEDQVLNDWQGLGYNTRARNLHATARIISTRFSGEFPATCRELMALPGIGPYTAAAVASFAFEVPVPVIDTNVIRVISRFLGLSDPVGTTTLHRQISAALEPLMGRVTPSEFNQAIMDFGATQCVPANPACETCPLSGHCVAYAGDLVAALPVRKPRRSRRKRFLHYLVLHNDHGIMLRKRTARDIWQHMYDFPLVEADRADPDPGLMSDLLQRAVPGVLSGPDISGDNQILTHQHIHCVFYTYAVQHPLTTAGYDDCVFVEYQNLHNFAVPKIIDCYFRSNSIHL